MVRFHVGERVSFDPDGRMRNGVLLKFNPKTVIVLADEGQRWKVSPQFLHHLVDDEASCKVITLRRLDKNAS